LVHARIQIFVENVENILAGKYEEMYGIPFQ